ncbi:ECF transporter S component [Fervidibacillus halotolerans]|uniref:ECF transporter S component n=1 Tax=Fervidibacillus halotolerans TaxID=2980027 RepID=A0A9E8RYJ0_9BACI|nr:ECF transporter S component [Fervidibacillus halotolerans]WAA12254.1 ECF transporter S component [Fervidibacillus halotolerans]
MKKGKIEMLAIFFLLTCLLLLFTLFFHHHYMLTSVVFLTLTFIPFFIRFEKKNGSGRELVVLAILAAVASVSRIPFASIPSVQPMTFVIIMTGAVFGIESGFVVGALSAIVSNFFLYQGPWTVWQMYAWGLVGILAGLLKQTFFIETAIGRVIFGIVTGFLFSWIMNIWVVLTMVQNFSIEQVLVFYASSFPFDLSHALSNAFFLLVFAKRWISILTRFQKKYGLLE